MSAQSRSVRMHLVSSATICSLRQASAQAVHAWAQALTASMVAASLVRSRLIACGYVSSIGIVVMATSGGGPRNRRIPGYGRRHARRPYRLTLLAFLDGGVELVVGKNAL